MFKIKYSPGPKRSGQKQFLPQYAKLGMEPGVSIPGHGVIVVARRWSSYEGSQPTSYNESARVSTPSARTLAISLLEQYGVKKTNLYNGLIHVLSNETYLIRCYEEIRSNAGANTPGVMRETLDSIDLRWFRTTSEEIKSGRYNFKPARRILIPKPGKTSKRPLGMPNPREKIVQKALQVVLELIFEPTFSAHSYGFRAGKGTHGALRTLHLKGSNYAWAIEGDIEKCFDSIDHEKLMKLITRSIRDDKTQTLIRKSLKAGYVDPQSKKVVRPKIGTPQGSVISPLYSNIALHQMDRYISKLIQFYNKGKLRRINPSWKKINRNQHLSNGQKRKLTQGLPSRDPVDPGYRRMMYVRYADDFVILVAGPRSECETIKSRLTGFLTRNLNLKLSKDKTHISNTAKGFYFLGAHIKRVRVKHKILTHSAFHGGSKGKRRMNPRLRTLAPIKKLIEKLKSLGFVKMKQENYVATSKSGLIYMDHGDILAYYNQKIRGVMNYYSFAGNRGQLAKVSYLLRMSCALTLAQKYKLKTSHKAFRKFGSDLKDRRTGMSLYTPSSYKALHQYNVSLPNQVDAILERSWWSKLTRFSFDLKCAVCNTSPVEMHHVRKITKVRKRISKGLGDFDMISGAFKRKQVPLCRTHHADLHHGKLSEPQLNMIRNYI